MRRKSSTSSKIPLKMEKRGSIVLNEKLDKPPKILQAPNLIYRIKEGNSIMLETKVDAQPEADFQWRFNNFEAHNGKLIKIERIDKNWSRITFKKPISAQYEVLAKNYLGQDSALTKVIIEYEDSKKINNEIITIQPNNVTEVKKNDKTNELKKTKENELLKSDKNDLKITTNNLYFINELNELLFTNFNEGDQLRIDMKIHSTNENNETIDACEFQWLLNEKEVPKEFVCSTDYLTTLTVPKINSAMSGKLTVVAKNLIGCAISSANIKISQKGFCYVFLNFL